MPQPAAVTPPSQVQTKRQTNPQGSTTFSGPPALSLPNLTPTPCPLSATALSKWQQHVQKAIGAF
eukprot:8124901-Ditylum_brightwellii.AAC.1